MDNVRRQMREALRAARGGVSVPTAADRIPTVVGASATGDGAGDPDFPGGLTPPPEPTSPTAGRVDAEPAFDQSWRRRFSAVVRFRAWCERRRIRPHVMSGIEFQMAVFIIGPLLGAVLPVTLVAIALILPFELAMVYKFWLSTKDFDRQLAGARAAAGR
jgi:hypothetical protein